MGRLRAKLSPLRHRLDAIDPTPNVAALALRRRLLPPLTLASVYRHHNANTLVRVLRRVTTTDTTDIRLWALDTAAPELARWTIGTGAGGRFQLLNQLLAGASDGYLVISDDDFTFTRGDLALFMKIVELHGFDLAQPTHARGSARSYPLTTTRALTIARDTTFVEIGPLVAISPEMRDHIFPFPERTPMGWGVDIEWADYARSGERRFGVIDATRIHHTGAPGKAYGDESLRQEREASQAAIRDRGIESIADIQHTLATHRPWHYSTAMVSKSPR